MFHENETLTFIILLKLPAKRPSEVPIKNVFSQMARDIPQILLLLGHFVIKKLKILLTFFWKILWTFYNYSSTPFETFQKTLPIAKTSRFWFEDLENFISWKKCTFYEFSKILDFDLRFSGTTFSNRGWKYRQTCFFLQNVFVFGNISMMGEEEGYPRVLQEQFSST